MIDFTSALYLDFKHSSADIKGWQQLTTGVPAALSEFAQSRQISQQVASMQGFENGMCAPSTLHLYWDLFGFLRKKKITVFADEKIYPVSLYGIERLYGSAIQIHTFRHLHADDLLKIITTKLKGNNVPVVLTDGWCPQCGKPAPLNYYAEIINPLNGKIIIDDTQAFGIFGERKTQAIYGNGGGGILQWLNAPRYNVITLTSLAKAFGVPIAVISGGKQFIEAFEQHSETRVNSSQVSIAHLNAALNALKINDAQGDKRRKKLWHNVALFRSSLLQAGVNLKGGIFPVQSITDWPADNTMRVHDKLNTQGIKTVLTAGHISAKPSLSFIIRCDHSFEEIKKATALNFMFGRKEKKII